MPKPFDKKNLKLNPALVEALLFASGGPMPVTSLAEALHAEVDDIKTVLGELRTQLKSRGVVLVEGDDGFELGVAPAERSQVAAALSHAAQPLSQSAVEVLTIVAYRQPVAKITIDELRGVASDASLKTLLARDLIVSSGMHEGSTQYRTTNHFLKTVGVTQLSELPPQKGLR